LALLCAVPVAVGADTTALWTRAGELREAGQAVGTERQSALVQLYALESELESARADVRSLQATGTRLALEHRQTRQRLAIAERAAQAATRRLEELLRSLYERREVGALDVLLGARSLDDALSRLDSLDRAAATQRRTLAQARSTRAQLARLDAQLTAREAELARVAVAAEQRARELEARTAAKSAYVASLRRRQQLTAREVTVLETAAQEAQEEAAALQPAASAAPEPIEAMVAADGTRMLTVTAIGYSLPGTTATGLPVGPGIVAVDPNVIPLGTRLYVPGYGEAVAADTGSAIRGAVIDLWFRTVAEARAWGRRTVVVTIG
jgi:3D (Asp-Asp-Asp) domain-containing protein